jgi:peptidyl-prolyl cis-trans isomerase A (cyclophilin A)
MAVRRFFGVMLVVAVAGTTLVLARPAQTVRPADLMDPTTFTQKAPATFRALFDTSAGMFVVQVHREWAPQGADRFFNLVKRGFYTDCRIFRVIKNFAAQWGLHGDPEVNAVWAQATLAPDRARKSNIRGRVTFAMGDGAASRTTQVFINLGDNSRLDIDGFAPFGEVTTSMLLVERLFAEYGEAPDQRLIHLAGNRYLLEVFPRLDYIRKATIEP